MDQVFGQLGGLAMEQEADLSFVDDSKEIMNEISMDLEDFKFDFDTISDSLGPWIQPNDIKLDLSDDEDLKSENIDLKDLDITEAVRYDCMWSSNTTPGAVDNKQQQTLCENSLFEEFLKIIDTSQYDLDIDIKSVTAEKTTLSQKLPRAPDTKILIPNCSTREQS